MRGDPVDPLRDVFSDVSTVVVVDVAARVMMDSCWPPSAWAMPGTARLVEWDDAAYYVW